MAESVFQTVYKVLETFEEPPTVTELRYRVAEQLPLYPAEDVRNVILGMVQRNQLLLTKHRRIALRRRLADVQ